MARPAARSAPTHDPMPPAASSKEALEMAHDPVCGMTVDDKSPYKSTHAGQTYLFCSPGCKTKFDEEPERYTPPVGAEDERRSQP